MKKIIGIGLLLLFTGSTFGQSNGTNMFDESFVHEIRITFEQENFWDSLEYYYEVYLTGGEKQYMLAKVEIDGTVIDSVGVREKGFFSNWGSAGLKEPLKIDFNEYVPGKRYDGLKKLNLQNGFADPTLMRDAVAYKFMRDAGVTAPRTSYSKVYLNDTYWGLYVSLEQVDDRFLKNWFENDNGNLYKCINNTNLDWQGPSKAAYEDEFGLRTNRELDDWSDFIELVDKINEDSEFEDSIATQLQMNNYLRVLASDVLMYNWDSYYNHGRNFYMYYDSLAGAFQWIPWDYNLAFSGDETNIVIEYEIGGEADPKPLVINVMDSDVYRTIYFNHLCVLLDNYFSLDNLEDYIDNTKDLIQSAVEDDPNKYFTTSQFNTAIETDLTYTDDWGVTTIPGLKPFIASRYATVSAQLSANSHNCTALSIAEEVIKKHSIYPNPSITGIFNIDFATPVSVVSVYSISGELLLTQNVIATNYFALDLSEFSAGMYIVDLQGETKEQMRIVKQ